MADSTKNLGIISQLILSVRILFMAFYMIPVHRFYENNVRINHGVQIATAL
jgi:hypothetical protein